jgi:alkylated DNA repair dioxygenase AlkB
MPEDQLDLRDALELVRRDGAAHVPRFVGRELLRPLRREVDSGPFRDMTGEHGRIRMEIDGYDLAMPMAGFPLMRQLAEGLGASVRERGSGIRGLATWRPNEIGVARYRPGSLGITPHLDGKWYRRLVIVVTIYGRARFAVCRTREGEIITTWHPGPGDLVLMRGPGLAGERDGRPFHLVEGPPRGERCSLGVRMSVVAS